MIFKPAQLGREGLAPEALAADIKTCKRFGPCGAGREALYLSSFCLDRRYYLPYGCITRVFKRVAMSKGGFSHKGVFASIPYLVVEYDGGKQRQCQFKDEEQVDQLLTEGDVYAAPEEITSKLMEVVDGLPDILQGYAKGIVEGLTVSSTQVTHSARETLVRLGTQAADAALNGAVYRTAHAIFYTLAFSAVVFLLRRVMRALLVLRKLPVLKQTDQALGLVAGLAKGALLVWLAAWIIPFLVEVPPEVREGSFLLRHTTFVTQGPLMAKLFSLPGIGGKASL